MISLQRFKLGQTLAVHCHGRTHAADNRSGVEVSVVMFGFGFTLFTLPFMMKLGRRGGQMYQKHTHNQTKSPGQAEADVMWAATT